MSLNAKSWMMTAICIFLLASSLFVYRWLKLNEEQILLGKELIDSNHAELIKLKRKVDEFKQIDVVLKKDESLTKEYFKEKISHHSEFGRDGVENIEKILDSTYSSNGFFELSKLYIKNAPAGAGKKETRVSMVVEGQKRLEK